MDFSLRIEETTDTKRLRTSGNYVAMTNTLIDIYDLEIINTKGDFTINTEASKADRAELISIPNTHHEDIIQT